MRKLAIAFVALTAPSLSATTYDYYQIPHQTKVREDRWQIRSIYQDVTSPTLLTIPAKSMADHAQLDVSYGFSNLYREEFASNPDMRDEGEQHLAEVRARIRIWRWISTELHTGVVAAPIQDNPDVTDLDALVVMTMYEDRYRGGAIAFGVGYPIGQGKALGEGHKGDPEELAYILQLRFTESVGFHVWNLNVGGRITNEATTQPDDPRLLEDGGVIPKDEWKHRISTLDATFAYTYRIVRWLRVGAEGRMRLDWYNGKEDETEFKDRRFEAIGMAEFTIDRNFSIRGGAGVDPDLLDADGDVDAFVAHGSLLVRF